MRSGLGSRSNSRGRWTAFPSATGADLHAGPPKGIVVEDARPAATVPTSPEVAARAAVRAAGGALESPRESRGWVDLHFVILNFVSGSICDVGGLSCPQWMLKQLQHDELWLHLVA